MRPPNAGRLGRAVFEDGFEDSFEESAQRGDEAGEGAGIAAAQVGEACGQDRDGIRHGA